MMQRRESMISSNQSLDAEEELAVIHGKSRLLE